MEHLENHATAVAACRAFGRQHESNPFVIVARSLEAWHLLKGGETPEAVKLFETMVSADRSGLPWGASRIARAWLTRIDREAVKKVLRAYYVRNVEYPATLEVFETLPKSRQPPLFDRFGTPWAYKLKEFRRLKGITGQRYDLRCRSLWKESELSAALAAGYAAGIDLVPERVVASRQAGAAVVLARGASAGDAEGEKVQIQEGRRLGDIVLAHVGQGIIILADNNHWRVVPRPR
jgi:hypothetical protein